MIVGSDCAVDVGGGCTASSYAVAGPGAAADCYNPKYNWSSSVFNSVYPLGQGFVRLPAKTSGKTKTDASWGRGWHVGTFGGCRGGGPRPRPWYQFPHTSSPSSEIPLCNSSHVHLQGILVSHCYSGGWQPCPLCKKKKAFVPSLQLLTHPPVGHCCEQQGQGRGL